MDKTLCIEVPVLLQQFDVSKYESYHALMRAFLLHAMANTDQTGESILYELYDVNKTIYNYVCKDAFKRFKAD